FVRSETQRLVQYLVTLRALPRDGSAVQILVIAPPRQRAVFEQALPSDARLVFRVVEYADALKAVKLRRPPEGASAEALFAHLAAHKPPAEQFASREDRRRYFLWQLQRGIVGAGAAAFVACALVGASRWLEAISLRGQAAEQNREARNAAQQYERITSTFPITDTTTENLKVTVVEFRRIAAQVQRFANALVGEGYELVRTQLPFDITSEGVLTGDIGGASESGEAPRFTVVLGRRLP